MNALNLKSYKRKMKFMIYADFEYTLEYCTDFMTVCNVFYEKKTN